MGIRVYCPNGHRLNLKSFLAGRRGICPRCGAKFDIPECDPALPGDTTGDDIAVLPAAADVPQAREDSARGPTFAGLDESVNVSPGPGDFDPGTIAVALGSEPPSGDALGFASIAVPAPTAGREVGPREASDAATTFPDVATGSKAAQQTMTATARERSGGGEPAASGRPPGKQSVPATPASTWYVRHPLHGQFGPATDETVRQWVAEGRISDDTLVWRDGWSDWRSASSLLSAVGVTSDAGSGRSPSLATLDLSASAAASGAALTADGALGAPGQRAAARRKSNQTMRIVSLALTIAVTLLTCLLIYVLTR